MTERPPPRPEHPSPAPGRPPGDPGERGARRVDNEDWARRHWDVTDFGGRPVTDIHQLLLPGDDPVQMARTVLRSPAAAGAPAELLAQCRQLVDAAGTGVSTDGEPTDGEPTDGVSPDGEHRFRRGPRAASPASADPAAGPGDVTPER